MGNHAGEGPGETRPATGPAREDQGTSGAQNVYAGSGTAAPNGRPEKGPWRARQPLPTRFEGLAPLPEDYRLTIQAGLPAIEGARLSAAQLAAIEGHIQLLLAWNEAINLSGIAEPGAMAREHVLDSLTALPLLRQAGIDELLDIGSGGGFPGLPLAIAVPARRALLVESIAKKARFLEVAAAALGVADRVAVAARRAEDLAADPRHRGRWPAVVARAVAGLPELAELALPLLRTGGLLVAWKRQPLAAEWTAAERAAERLGGRLAGTTAVTVAGLEDHVLVSVEKVLETPALYPRNQALRRRRPLG
jgi:16S rRNA (guanine527-N7)-methyltransferase